MDTFHIQPSSALADEVVAEVRGFAPDTFIAVRGEVFDGREEVYTVSECPDQQGTHRYMWKYVLARDWLADYEEREYVDKRYASHGEVI